MSGSAGIVAPPPVLYLGALTAGLALHFVFPWSMGNSTVALRLAGVLLLLASAGLARWSFITLRRAGTSADPSTPSKALVTDGPFKLSRNPIYLAMNGLYLGVALLVNSWWPVVLMAPLLALMQWGVILREERYLEREFGAAYSSYKSATRRWL